MNYRDMLRLRDAGRKDAEDWLSSSETTKRATRRADQFDQNAVCRLVMRRADRSAVLVLYTEAYDAVLDAAFRQEDRWDTTDIPPWRTYARELNGRTLGPSSSYERGRFEALSWYYHNCIVPLSVWRMQSFEGRFLSIEESETIDQFMLGFDEEVQPIIAAATCRVIERVGDQEWEEQEAAIAKRNGRRKSRRKDSIGASEIPQRRAASE